MCRASRAAQCFKVSPCCLLLIDRELQHDGMPSSRQIGSGATAPSPVAVPVSGAAASRRRASGGLGRLQMQGGEAAGPIWIGFRIHLWHLVAPSKACS